MALRFTGNREGVDEEMGETNTDGCHLALSETWPRVLVVDLRSIIGHDPIVSKPNRLHFVILWVFSFVGFALRATIKVDEVNLASFF